jgi:hypothetical protein
MPGSVAPGEAASIIFPRNNGNKLVVNEESAMNNKPQRNLLRCGFKYLKRISASRRVSFEIFALLGSVLFESLKCLVAVAIFLVSNKKELFHSEDYYCKLTIKVWRKKVDGVSVHKLILI